MVKEALWPEDEARLPPSSILNEEYRNRSIPLWIRRRRQELLSLDDTLPYDEGEHSLLGDACLDTLFDDDEVVASATNQDDSSNTNASITLDGKDIDLSLTSTQSPPLNQSTQVTKHGRKYRQSKWLQDYVTD